WLQVQALCYCNRNLTDGFVPAPIARGFLAKLSSWEDDEGRLWKPSLLSGMQSIDADEVDWIALVVKAGIWLVVPGGYRIHDYERYQRSKAEVLAARAKNAAKVQRHRNRVRNLVTTPDSNRSPVPVPVPVPVPEPVPKKKRSRSLR